MMVAAYDTSVPRKPWVSPDGLGSAAFRADHGIKYAYLAGAMYRGIASARMVMELGKAGLLGFLGTGGMTLEEIATGIGAIQRELGPNGRYGMNLLCNIERPQLEQETVALYLKHAVRRIEAAAFMRMTPALVRYRLAGVSRRDGRIEVAHHVVAKVSRPEVATLFMQPAPEPLVAELREARLITAAQAQLAAHVPMSDDICVEADSGGHTDRGVAFALLPAILALRDDIMRQRRYARAIRVGAAGGIGTPQAAAAAFMMGADFVLTGSINQCTIEAGTSDAVKDLLQQIDVQDTVHVPAGDMFELGAKAQVVRRGLFFPARANKLYDVFQRFGSLEEIDAQTRSQLEEKIYQRSLAEVWEETRAYYRNTDPDKLREIESDPRRRMAAVFRWYFAYSTQLALQGSAHRRVDYQIQCGPALGSFNQWVKGTALEGWRERRVADIAERLMQGTAAVFNVRIEALTREVLA